MPQKLRRSARSRERRVAIVLGSVGFVLLLICSGAVYFVWHALQRPLREHDEDYAQARKTFRTELRFAQPSPQPYAPSNLPRARRMSFRSGDLTLTAFVDLPPGDGRSWPAVLFLHGGFAFGDDDWDMPQPYRDAGYIVMMPSRRRRFDSGIFREDAGKGLFGSGRPGTWQISFVSSRVA